jgi:hypothetical protein
MGIPSFNPALIGPPAVERQEADDTNDKPGHADSEVCLDPRGPGRRNPRNGAGMAAGELRSLLKPLSFETYG